MCVQVVNNKSRRLLTHLVVCGWCCVAALLLSGASGWAATLFEEGFEGPGYENTGWIDIGLPDPDYTAQPLEGSQSLHLSEIALVRRTFQYSGHFHFYFRVQWNLWDPYNNIVDWEDATTATTASVYADNDKLLLLHGSASALGTTHIATNTPYHVWVDWTQGTVSNGTMQLFISSDGFKPSQPDAILTNGNANTPVDRLFVGPFSPGVDVIFDSFLVSDQPIGDSHDANHPPTLTDLTDQTIDQDTVLGPLAFTIGDVETPAQDLQINVTSSNPNVVPANGLVLGGAGTDRTLTVTPAAGATGQVTITLEVNDGSRTTTDRFQLTVNSTNAPVFVFTEGFEGTGYENSGWVEFGGPNPNYSDGALDGAQSLRFLGAQSIRRPFSYPTKFNLYFQVKWNVYEAFKPVLYWEDANFSIAASLYADFNRLLIIHGSASVPGTTILQEGVTYHVWLEWTYGSGSTGTLQLFMSTNGTKPDVAEASITAGTGNGVQRMYVGPTGTVVDMLYDKFLVSLKPIGNNPGLPENQPPTISNIPAQQTPEDTPTEPTPFVISDPETPSGQLTLTITSSNPSLVPVTNCHVQGVGTERTLTIEPISNAFGNATITLRVTDADGASASSQFLLTVESVLDPIEVAVSPRDTIGVVGRSASLLVTALSELPLRYQWSKDGQELPEQRESRLTFPALQAGDAALYAVVVSNDDTSVRLEATLQVLSTLPQPRIEAIEHRGNETLIAFTTVSGASYRVEYKDAVEEPEWTPLKTVDGTGWVMECTDSTITLANRIYRVWTD